MRKTLVMESRLLAQTASAQLRELIADLGSGLGISNISFATRFVSTIEKAEYGEMKIIPYHTLCAKTIAVNLTILLVRMVHRIADNIKKTQGVVTRYEAACYVAIIEDDERRELELHIGHSANIYGKSAMSHEIEAAAREYAGKVGRN